jgi:hypothetical protein
MLTCYQLGYSLQTFPNVRLVKGDKEVMPQPARDRMPHQHHSKRSLSSPPEVTMQPRPSVPLLMATISTLFLPLLGSTALAQTTWSVPINFNTVAEAVDDSRVATGDIIEVNTSGSSAGFLTTKVLYIRAINGNTPSITSDVFIGGGELKGFTITAQVTAYISGTSFRLENSTIDPGTVNCSSGNTKGLIFAYNGTVTIKNSVIKDVNYGL